MYIYYYIRLINFHIPLKRNLRLLFIIYIILCTKFKIKLKISKLITNIKYTFSPQFLFS